MRISKRNLKLLIEKYLIIESEGKEDVITAEVQGKIYLAVRPIVKAKEESDMKDIDGYFHALGSVQGFISLADEFGADRIATNVRDLGQKKEILDYYNPFGETPAIKVGPAASAAEFDKDLTNNEIGINIGTNYLKSGNLDINRIYDQIPYTPNDLYSMSTLPKRWNYLFNCRYGWAFKEYPHLYSPDKKFIQPRYNIKLTPEGRGKDWAIWQKENGSLPRWAESLKKDKSNLLFFSDAQIPADYEACSVHEYTTAQARAGEEMSKDYLDLKLNYAPLPKK